MTTNNQFIPGITTTPTIVLHQKQKEGIRSLVNNIYDVQKVRIMMGNRLFANLYVETSEEKERLAEFKKTNPEKSKKEQEDKAKKFREDLEQEFLIVQAVAADRPMRTRIQVQKVLDQAKSQGIKYITDFLAYNSVENFLHTRNIEDSLTKTIEYEVKAHPMWDLFFKDVKGCGPLMAAVCIAYLDPTKARHVSSFWKYAGLDVVVDENGVGVGRNRSASHMVPRTYTKQNGEVTEGVGLSFQPFLKTKLLGVLGSSFLRAGRDGKYAQIYYDYKNREIQKHASEPLRDIIYHKRANRYAVKQFLADLWVAWRTYLGLEVTEPYAVAKLGMRPHGTDRFV